MFSDSVILIINAVKEVITNEYFKIDATFCFVKIS